MFSLLRLRTISKKEKSKSRALASSRSCGLESRSSQKRGPQKAGERKMRPLPAKKGTRTHAHIRAVDPWNSSRAVFVLFVPFALLLLAIIKTLGARLNSNARFFFCSNPIFYFGAAAAAVQWTPSPAFMLLHVILGTALTHGLSKKYSSHTKTYLAG